MQKIITFGLALLFLGLFSACSENDSRVADKEDVANVTHSSKEELLKTRVLGRMQALIDMDWEKAYSYLSPARRQVLPYQNYATRMKISAILRKHAEIEKTDCKTDVCDVVVLLDFIYIGGVIEAMQGQERRSSVHEKWIYTENNWWFVPE